MTSALMVTLCRDIANETLTAVQGIFAAASVALPDRQYVSDGSSAVDCEQLTIDPTRIFTGLPNAPRLTPELPGTQRSFEMQINLWRCAPTLDNRGQPPSPSDIQSAGESRLVDAWLLMGGLAEAYGDRTWLDRCSALAIVELRWVGAEGGFVGLQLTVQVQV